MAKVYAGARIRALRSSLDLTQVEMARQLSLSTSYLNQLENDQRPVTVTVLMNLISTFKVDASFFSPDRDARQIADLSAAFPSVPVEQLRDFIARYPELADAVIDSTQHPSNPNPGPFEQVRDFFYDTRNYIDELDRLGEENARELGQAQIRLTRLASALDHDLGVTVRYRRNVTGPRRVFDSERRELNVRADLSEAQICFQLALQYGLLAHRDLLEELSAASFRDEEARRVALLGLAQYYAAAVTLPYSDFFATAEDYRYDIDRLSRHWGAGIESICHRLSTLQRPGSVGVPFFFVRTDRAGNISKRQSAMSFHFARSGGSCPLWVIHRAFETPGRVTRQVAEMPDGRRYLWVARTIAGNVREFGAPRKEFAVGLGCDLNQAERLIYSRGLDLSPESATPIGPGCARCVRSQCPQRAFPQQNRPIALNLDITVDEPYRTLPAFPGSGNRT
ncbi:ImmA/IrrE family metallo-endopeptidase [Corynebacterium poyangense]|uniref:ImmA/IrrE family metallo-endopeptidase n=1 Tax=Corynebacterium poyangense TaxID=2684405 RepID=A0A7H0SME7_9CORY|nr:short-chain fatty acyl-CoA regulator family protein [Corynebacterium poyangense]MBZ8176823.1 DUF2083 domain-containing protein [Corynebacterium poyangense]QNQ89722.1 ImmA/IrrE family metallo-endopeptidase [Corynebacterium poyangense]